MPEERTQEQKELNSGTGLSEASESLKIRLFIALALYNVHNCM